MKKTENSGNGNVTAPGALQINPRMGHGFLRYCFGGASYMPCVIEIVKDGRDWDGTKICIETRDKSMIEFRDNGNGMDRKNRDAFASVSCTTATKPGQQGRYGSGSKYMLFSFASHVEVVTAPKEEPGKVYRFSFETQTYEERVMKGLEILPEVMPKTAESWPYHHPFGTVIRYKFSDPKSRSILRGDGLALELTARLPCKFSDIVEVDGKPIPAKEIVGQRFEGVISDPHLGDVVFEFYRPKRRRNEESLYVTGGEVGEPTFMNFYKVLGELRDRVPPIFLEKDVCGTIQAPFFRDYVNEDRTTVAATIADTPYTLRLLLILERISPKLQQTLDLKIETASNDERHTAALETVVGMFNSRFEKMAPPPPTDDNGIYSPPPPQVPEEKPPLILENHREYEVGQEIVILAKVRKDLVGKIEPQNIRWQTDRSRAKDVKTSSDGLIMTAETIGPGSVSADLPGTPYAATAHYSVVTAREFRLSIPHATIPRGSQFWVMGVNTDKLVGELRWSLKGPGEIEAAGNRVTYTATRVGRAELRGYDSKRPDVAAACEITVQPVPPDTFPIFDQRFVIKTHRIQGQPAYAKPVTMLPGSGTNRVHTMLINVLGYGYQSALERGDPAQFLAHAIAMEFARFRIFDLQTQEEGDTDPRDAATLANDVLNEGFKIIEVVMDQTGKGKK